MDFETLARAKAYTDKKTEGCSGGSGGGIPVVELTTVPSFDGVPVSDAENAALNEMAASGTPFYVKFPLNNMTIVTPVSVYSTEGMIVAYYAVTPASLGINLGWVNNGGNWLAQAELLT